MMTVLIGQPSLSNAVSFTFTPLKPLTQRVQQERKFNVVIYGIECSEGSARHIRSESDRKEVSKVINKVSSDVPEISII